MPIDSLFLQLVFSQLALVNAELARELERNNLIQPASKAMLEEAFRELSKLFDVDHPKYPIESEGLQFVAAKMHATAAQLRSA